MSDETTIMQKLSVVIFLKELTELCQESIQSDSYVYHDRFKELTTEQLVEITQALSPQFNDSNLTVVPTLVFKDNFATRVLKVQSLNTFNSFATAQTLVDNIISDLKAGTIKLPLEITVSELDIEDASDFYDVYQELRHELSVLVVELTIIGNTPRILIPSLPHSNNTVKVSDEVVSNNVDVGSYTATVTKSLEETNPNIPLNTWKPSDGFMESPMTHDISVEAELKLKLDKHLNAGLDLETFEYHTYVLDTLRGITLNMVLSSVNDRLSPHVFKFNTKEVDGVMHRTLVLDLPDFDKTYKESIAGVQGVKANNVKGNDGSIGLIGPKANGEAPVLSGPKPKNVFGPNVEELELDVHYKLTPLENGVKESLHAFLNTELDPKMFHYTSLGLDELHPDLLDQTLSNLNIKLAPYVLKWSSRNLSGMSHRALVLDLPGVKEPEEETLQIKSLKADRVTFIGEINEAITELDYYLLGGVKPKHIKAHLTPAKATTDDKQILKFYINELSRKQCEVLCTVLMANNWEVTLGTLNDETTLTLTT